MNQPVYETRPMGQRHRHMRSQGKTLLRQILAKHGIVIPLREVRRILRDPGYKEDELGRLRSTIRKLTEHEIMDRMASRATAEIQAEEDARVFAMLDEIASPPPRKTRWDHLREGLV